jgi:hypothetical protein
MELQQPNYGLKLPACQQLNRTQFYFNGPYPSDSGLWGYGLFFHVSKDQQQ